MRIHFFCRLFPGRPLGQFSEAILEGGLAVGRREYIDFAPFVNPESERKIDKAQMVRCRRRMMRRPKNPWGRDAKNHNFIIYKYLSNLRCGFLGIFGVFF